MFWLCLLLGKSVTGGATLGRGLWPPCVEGSSWEWREAQEVRIPRQRALEGEELVEQVSC